MLVVSVIPVLSLAFCLVQLVLAHLAKFLSIFPFSTPLIDLVPSQGTDTMLFRPKWPICVQLTSYIIRMVLSNLEVLSSTTLVQQTLYSLHLTIFMSLYCCTWTHPALRGGRCSKRSVDSIFLDLGGSISIPVPVCAF